MPSSETFADSPRPRMKVFSRPLLLDHVLLYLELSVVRGAMMPMGRLDLSTIGCKQLGDEKFEERDVGQRVGTVLPE